MRDLSRLSWPACINDSISIGMSDQYEQIDNYSNFDKDRLDFYALGNMQVAIPGGSVKMQRDHLFLHRLLLPHGLALKTLIHL